MGYANKIGYPNFFGVTHKWFSPIFLIYTPGTYLPVKHMPGRLENKELFIILEQFLAQSISVSCPPGSLKDSKPYVDRNEFS